MTLQKNDQGKLLFVTLSNIGDAVMTIPVLQVLHRLYPDTTIDIVVDKRTRMLFEHCPYRGEIFEKNKREFLRGMPRLVIRLRQNHYRLVVDLRTGILPFFVSADKKLGKSRDPADAVHSVEKHLSVIRSLDYGAAVPQSCLWTGDEDRNFAGRLLGEDGDKKILCIGPGANSAFKVWRWQNYRDLVNCLKGQFDIAALLGNSNDRHIAEEIARGSRIPALNMCGKTSLLQAAEILKRASQFVGNDSGLGHMAAAVNVPTITLFGPGQPERYRPWGASAKWLVGENRQIDNIAVGDVVKLVTDHSGLH